MGWFKEQNNQNANEENIIVTFYFTSGVSYQVPIEKSAWEKLKRSLGKSWPYNNVITDTFGFTFEQVTHYIVK